MTIENFQACVISRESLHIQKEKYKFKRGELSFLRACSVPGVMVGLQ